MSKLIKVLLIVFVLIGLSPVSFAGRTKFLPIMSVDEFNARVKKYDNLDFFNLPVRATFYVKYRNDDYEIEDDKIGRLGYFIHELRKYFRRPKYFSPPQYLPKERYLLTDFEQNGIRIIMTIALDDKNKAEAAFDKFYAFYLAELEKEKSKCSDTRYGCSTKKSIVIDGLTFYVYFTAYPTNNTSEVEKSYIEYFDVTKRE